MISELSEFINPLQKSNPLSFGFGVTVHGLILITLSSRRNGLPPALIPAVFIPTGLGGSGDQTLKLSNCQTRENVCYAALCSQDRPEGGNAIRMNDRGPKTQNTGVG
jgi:hypothetical protein